MVDKDKQIDELKKKLEKARAFAQVIIPGFEGAQLTKLQYDFAVIRARFPKDKDHPNHWCMREAGSEGSQKTLNNLASRYLKMPEVQQIINTERAKQAEVLRLNGDYVLSEVIELGKMCMGRLPVVSSEVDDDGNVKIKSSLVFNPTGAKGALELLGKNQKLWTDKTELSGADGGDISVARKVIYVNADNLDKVNGVAIDG